MVEKGQLSIELDGPGALDLETYLHMLTAWHKTMKAVAVEVAPESRVVFEIVEMRPRGATVQVVVSPRKRRRAAGKG